MDAVKRRVGAGSVVAGSVWESRMKIDEVKGGIKVFNGEDSNEEGGGGAGGGGVHVYRRVRRADVGKRKTWNSENFDKSPIQIAKEKPDEPVRELSVCSDGIKKSPIQTRKTRSDLTKELTVSVDGLERSPIPPRKGRSAESGNGNDTEKTPAQLRKVKSETNRVNNESGIEKSPGQLRKSKSESIKVADKSSGGIEKPPAKMGKAKIESDKASDESAVMEVVDGSVDTIEKDSDDPVDEIEKSSVEIEKAGSDETPKESGVCKEEEVKSPPKAQVNDGNDAAAADNAVNEEEAEEDEEDDGEEEEEEEKEEEEEIEVEIEENSLDDIKEISIPEQKSKKAVQEEKRVLPLPQKPLPISSNVNRNLPPAVPEQKPFSSNANKHQPPIVPKRAVIEEKRVHQTVAKPQPISPTIKKQPPIYHRHNRIYSNHAKPTPVPDALRRTPQTHNKLQNLIDLVMWRDVSKSAFVFGIGTFTIISSSYTKDLNISLISVASYLGLVYLAAIFLYRSFIFRGASDVDDSNQDYVLGEEEAIWLIKIILPYLNEFLLKLRCLFSGDPATTMKLAVLLFIMARSGSSITIWKMVKLGFFGVFTVPKVCSCYSKQLTGYGNFWVRRFRDAWESCSHKKAVAAAIFTLVWNLSSIVARIWAVFMLFVAVRYYQQTMVVEEWVEDDTGGGADDTWQENVGGQRKGQGPTIVEIPKLKKGS